MGLIQDFIKEPETFLGKYAVIVGDETEWDGCKPPGVAKFFMQAKKANVVHLVRRIITGPKPSECVDAYWLPWKTKTATWPAPCSIAVENESGVEHVIRGNQVDRITVCEQKELEFRAGEQLQIKANLKTKEGLRLANGSIVTLEGVDPDTGDLQIKDKLDRVLTLDPSVRMLQYGYASTGKPCAIMRSGSGAASSRSIWTEEYNSRIDELR